MREKFSGKQLVKRCCVF